MSHVTVYDRVLTAEEIAALYTADSKPNKPLEGQMIQFWPMDCKTHEVK